MNITQKLKIAGFLLNIAEWDRHLEVTRQILNGIDKFEPYAAFLRLTKGKPSEGIHPRAIEAFLSENGLAADGNLIEVVVKIYDTKFNGTLDFEDFLKMTLARDNPKMRFEAAAKREIYDITEDQLLAEEIEYCLARFFSKAAEFVKKMKVDAESQSIISERDLFAQLGTTGGFLDFKTLKRYFESLNIVPKDSEIIAILRVIDINDDGIIEKTEFDYFISLFNTRIGNEVLLNKLIDRSRKDHEVNYFGERKERKEGLSLSASKTNGSGLTSSNLKSRKPEATDEGYRSRSNLSSSDAGLADERTVYSRIVQNVEERPANPAAYNKRSNYEVRESEIVASRDRPLRAEQPLAGSYAAAGRNGREREAPLVSAGNDRPERSQYTRTTVVERKAGEPLRASVTPPPANLEKKYEREIFESRLVDEPRSRSRSRNPTDIDRSTNRNRVGDNRSGSKEPIVTPSKRVRPEPRSEVVRSEVVRTTEPYARPREIPAAEIVTEEFVSKRTTFMGTGNQDSKAPLTFERNLSKTDNYSSANRHVEMSYSSKKERSPEWSKASKY